MVDSNFVTDPEVLNLANVAKMELDDLLVAAYGQDYFMTSVTFSTVANTENYSLSTLTSGTFYKLVGVDIQDPTVSGAWRDMDPYTFKERNNFANRGSLPVWSNQTQYRYRINGGDLSIRPVPAAPLSMRLYWTPQSTSISTTTSSFEDTNGWSEYIVIRAAISIKDKEESDTTELERDLARMTARIDGMKTNRDAAAPMKVVEVDSKYWGWWNR